MAFEKEVRNIARQLWPSSQYTGPVTVDNRERDGIFVTEESIHYFEATTSRTADNARKNLTKIKGLIEKLKRLHPDKAVKGWYITKDEPTGEQGAVIVDFHGIVTHQTYHQFYAKLADGKNYIRARVNHPFGSARNVIDYSFKIQDDEYVQPALINDLGELSSVGHLVKLATKSGEKIVVTGEYGVGKSMFLRDIFFRLVKYYESGNDNAFPVHINLVDHIEQYDPSECLTRHGTKIGLENPHQLVRAWKAGYIYLLLDGFDELTPRIATKNAKRAKDIRRGALELVKRFAHETPPRSSVFIVGRSNFFDDKADLMSSLGASARWVNYSIDDFNEDETSMYLQKKGFHGALPEWLPRRPLLVAYIISNPQLSGSQGDLAETDACRGWDYLLDKICEREVNQVYLALEAAELRQIYGRIGTKCRKKSDALGPISYQDCKEAFLETVQMEPEGRSVTALLRLPGLVGSGPIGANDGIVSGSRRFVTPDFLDAVACYDLKTFIGDQDYRSLENFRGVRHQLGEIGTGIAVLEIEPHSIKGKLNGALERVLKLEANNPLALDLIQCLNDSGVECGKFSVVTNITATALRVDGEADLSRICIKSCYFSEVIISLSDLEKAPRFDGCAIERVRTHFEESALEQIFNQCEIEAILQVFHEPTDPRLVALESILEKIFVQSRSGRLASALSRGLPPSAAAHVPRIIEILRKNDFIYEQTVQGRAIWRPHKNVSAPVRQILRNIGGSKDAVVAEVLKISIG